MNIDLEISYYVKESEVIFQKFPTFVMNLSFNPSN